MEIFRRSGVDTNQLALLCPDEVENALIDLPNLDFSAADTLFDGCAHLTGDQSFGLHLTDYIELPMLGTFGYLLGNAPTIRRLLEITEHYFPIFYRGAQISIQYNGSVCLLECDRGGVSLESRRHINEWTLAFFFSLISNYIEQQTFLLHTEFKNSAPADLTELKQVFGENISFNAPRTAFEFRADILDKSITGSSHHFLDILIEQAESFLQEILQPESLEARVKLLILERLELGEAKIEPIAHSLAMSRTSLNRRLSAKGTSFRKLRDSVIIQVADKVLFETNTTISLVAHKLGFSEMSAFDRSFRRITGMSPTEYRQAKR